MVTLTQIKAPGSVKGYLRKLPLLNFTAELYKDVSLENVYLICAQHIVSTTYALFHVLLQLGLKPSQISVIGKCYSTDPQAYNEIKNLNIDVCSASLEFDSHRSFDEQYRENVLSFTHERLNKVNGSKYKKIIVLDDGGELITAIHESLRTNTPIIGIEQTSSGFHKLKDKKIPFPIINVARSPAKLNYEAPIIAKLVIDTLVRRIKDLPSKPCKVLILGQGPIGSQIRELLSNDFQVETFDTTVSKSTIDPQDFESSLNIFDLIIGCTGREVFSRTLQISEKECNSCKCLKFGQRI